MAKWHLELSKLEFDFSIMLMLELHWLNVPRLRGLKETEVKAVIRQILNVILHLNIFKIGTAQARLW